MARVALDVTLSHYFGRGIADIFDTDRKRRKRATLPIAWAASRLPAMALGRTWGSRLRFFKEGENLDTKQLRTLALLLATEANGRQYESSTR